ncbi:OprD family outer membrane porin [Kistimonas scapharcae]|uniref:OprD family outer membrane porin n=1 Tax=Kistimonas scapharcae TaxID=1036133 RepID=A0ABP8V1C2_9GAMM
MRAFKLSALGAAVIAATAATAAQASVEQFVDDSTLNIKLRNAYFDNNVKNAKEDWHDWAQGIEVNYESGYMFGMIGFDASFYGSMKLDSSNEENGYQGGSDQLLRRTSKGDSTGFGKLGQAYLKGKLGDDDLNIHAKAGYMKHDTILLASSSSRLTPSSYKGYAFDANVYGVNLYGAYANEISHRTSQSYDDFENRSGEKIDNLYSVGAAYEIGNLYLNGEYGEGKDYMKLGYINAGYTFDISEGMSLLVDGQYYKAKENGKRWDGATYDEGFADDAKLVNLNTALTIDYLTLSLSYTKVDADNGDRSGAFQYWMADNDYGGGNFWTSRQISDFYFDGETVWQVGAQYDFTGFDMPGFYTGVTYTRGTFSNSDAAKHGFDEETELDVEVGYAFQQEALKGLSVVVKNGYHQTKGYQNADDGRTNNLRVYVDYTLSVF